MEVKKLCMAVLSALTLVAGTSHAAIQVAGTRIVFEGDQKEQTVRLTNTADAPVLAQIWLDATEKETDGKVEAGAQATPFILNPPVVRINGGKAQVIRLFKTAEVAALPADRESVFWFNALEVPAKVRHEDGENRLNIALRTRLKLFYRPAGLKADVIAAAEALQWRVRREGADYVVTCVNASPVHVSFSRLVLKRGDKETELGGGMVRPLADEPFRFAGAAAAGGGKLTLDFQYITDLGAFVPVTLTLPEEG